MQFIIIFIDQHGTLPKFITEAELSILFDMVRLCLMKFAVVITPLPNVMHLPLGRDKRAQDLTEVT